MRKKQIFALVLSAVLAAGSVVPGAVLPAVAAERESAAAGTESDIKSESAEEEESVSEPAEQEESVSEPAEQEESASEPAEQEESASESAEQGESAFEPAEQEESVSEPAEQEESVSEPAEQEESMTGPAAREDGTQGSTSPEDSAQGSAEQEDSTAASSEQTGGTAEAAEEEKGTTAARAEEKDNHFKAYLKGFEDRSYAIDITLSPGEERQMQIMVDADDYSGVSYIWKKNHEIVRQITEEEISQQNGIVSTDSLWVTGDGHSSYEVEVSDGFGNSQTIRFEISVDNRFSAYPEGVRIRESGLPDTQTTLFGFPGEEAVLHVCTRAEDTEGITYEWYDDNYNVMEENTDSLTVSFDSSFSRYSCYVRDRYGNSSEVYFNVRLAETFTAYPEGAAMDSEGEMAKEVSLSVNAGEKITLRVIAEPEEGINLTYSWENVPDDEDAPAGSYVTVIPEQSQEYWCYVEDQYGDYEEITFDVRVNHFDVRPQTGEFSGEAGEYISAIVYAKEGEKLNLSVLASGDDPSGFWYKWEKDGLEYGMYELLSEEGPSLEVTADYDYYYSCTAYDGLCNQKTVTFYIKPEEFDAYPENPALYGDGRKKDSKTIPAVKGETLTLKVITEAADMSGFHYQWYKSGNALEGETESTLTIMADESTYYRCRVSKDGIEETQYIDFSISVEGSSGPVITMNTAEYKDGGDTANAVYRAAYGEECTMRVTVKDTGASDQKYTVSWLDENKKVLAEGTDDFAYIVNESAVFYCKVTNSLGKGILQPILVKTDSGLTALPAGRTQDNYDSDNNLVQIAAEPSEPVTLKVEASAAEGEALRYTWQGRAMDFKGDQESGWQYFDTEGDTLTVAPEADTRYECIVSDRFGAAVPVRFDVLVSDKKDLSRAIIKLAETKPLYTGKPVEPEVLVVYRGQKLVKGEDFTVTYFGNEIPNYPSNALVRGAGAFTGKKVLNFTIVPLEQNLTVTAPALTPGVSGKVTVKNAKGYLYYDVVSGRDVVTVDSKGTLKALKIGTAKVLVGSSEALGYKKAEKTITVKVLPAAPVSLKAANMVTCVKLTWKKVPGATGYILKRAGKTIKTISGGSTVSFLDYTANKNGTTYNYSIYAKAATGTSRQYTRTGIIRLTRPVFTSVTNGTSKAVTLKWKKNAAVTGYIIEYSTKSDFAGAQKVTIAKPSAVTTTIRKLAKNKTCYVRIRVYKKVGTTRYYSLWSPARKITIRK